MPINIYYVIAEVPAPPRGPLIASNLTKNSLTLSWQPNLLNSDLDLSDPVSGYIVEKRDVTDGQLGSWLRVAEVRGHVNSCDVTNLLEGRFYFFRVLAKNKAGRSLPLEGREPVQTKSPYSEDV